MTAEPKKKKKAASCLARAQPWRGCHNPAGGSLRAWNSQPLLWTLLTSLCMAHQSGRPCIATVSNNFLFAGKTAVSLILRQQQVHVSQACISPQGHALCHRASDGKNISGCCKGFDSLITMDILGAQDERQRPVTTLSHWTQDGKKGPE